ncbi:MAG: arylsulfatase, partial [Verrucomicrobiota bacterium]
MAVSSLDLLPTFLAAAQSKPLTLREPMTHEDARNWREISRQFGSYDGMNLLPFLEQQAPEMSRTLFWRCQGQASVLQGTWKLIRPSHRSPQIFQPGLDQAEASDLILDEKETADGLMGALMRWESLLP